MFISKNQTLYCQVCDSCLGTFDIGKIIIVTCLDEDCKIKWSYVPTQKLPKALDYPGKKEPKICTCESCKNRK